MASRSERRAKPRRASSPVADAVPSTSSSSAARAAAQDGWPDVENGGACADLAAARVAQHQPIADPERERAGQAQPDRVRAERAQPRRHGRRAEVHRQFGGQLRRVRAGRQDIGDVRIVR
jgi:hypothetical protein